MAGRSTERERVVPEIIDAALVSAEASGPILTLGSQALGESAH